MLTAKFAFQCIDCGDTKPVQTNGGLGYATTDNGGKVCYDCCGKRDKQDMIDSGKATLYLVGFAHAARVTNWPNTLGFACTVREGLHNLARVRYDVWFTGPDGKPWYGVQYGNNTQICHCRRIKR